MQAKKTLQSASGGFSFFSNKEDKLQSAAELYVQAANAYRLQQMSEWASRTPGDPPSPDVADEPCVPDKEAGAAFEAAAKIHEEKLNEPDDAANIMVDAFKVYRKDHPSDAVRCLNKAIARYTAKGNFRRAASHKENAAELIEVEMGDRKMAMEYYADAARWYEDDGAKA